MSHTRIAIYVRMAVATLVATGTALCIGAGPAQAGPAADPTLSDQYSAIGTSHIGSIDANLLIAKAKLVETLDLKTLHIVRGTLPIAPQTVSFTALGVVPMRATTTLVQAAPVTGSIKPTAKGNVLKTAVSYTITLSNVEAQILGQWTALNVGDSCQTVDPAVISVGSPKGKYFDIAKGGVVTGSYTIGKFQNCHLLGLPGAGTMTVNSLVPGTDNTVRITLSHGRYVRS